MTMMTMMTTILATASDDEVAYKAAIEYSLRQKRVNHPSGCFEYRSAGRQSMRGWRPDASERRDCCLKIREPSRAYPLSINRHCRTVPHIANLYGVEAKELRKHYKMIKRVERIDVKLNGGNR